MEYVGTDEGTAPRGQDRVLSNVSLLTDDTHMYIQFLSYFVNVKNKTNHWPDL